jgi:hypothetical protein
MKIQQPFHFNRRWLAEAIHLTLAAAALWAAFLLRFEFRLDPFYRHMLWTALPLFAAVKLAIFRVSGLQDLAWRYTGFRDLLRIAASTLAASLAVAVALRVELTPWPRCSMNCARGAAKAARSGWPCMGPARPAGHWFPSFAPIPKLATRWWASSMTTRPNADCGCMG